MHIRLIIGLGNNGANYSSTYHNAGWLAIEAFTRIAAEKPFVVAPDRIFRTEESMNTSGDFVMRAMRRCSVRPEELLVVHDDADIALGSYKYSFARGSAGHKGVADVISALGTNAFWRLRIGIRKEGETKKAMDFVLDQITHDAQKALEGAIEQAAEQLMAPPPALP